MFFVFKILSEIKKKNNVCRVKHERQNSPDGPSRKHYKGCKKEIGTYKNHRWYYKQCDSFFQGKKTVYYQTYICEYGH